MCVCFLCVVRFCAVIASGLDISHVHMIQLRNNNAARETLMNTREWQ